MNSILASATPAQARTRLMRERDRILKLWEAEIRRRVPAAASLDEHRLRSTLPGVLDGLAAAWAGQSPAELDPCREHGRSRAALAHFTVADVLLEYRVLRQTLLSLLEEDGPLAPAERDAILDAIHHGMTEAVAQFAGVHVQREASLKDELAEALDTRDEYLSTATHELRTPISSILLSLQLLLKTVTRKGSIDARSMNDLLEPTLRQVDRLTRLVDMLLDVARVEKRHLRLERASHDLCTIAKESIARHAQQARQAGCALVLEACRPVIGHWDRMRLEQVLSNLLTNAIKYGAGQPVRLKVGTLPEGETAFVEVTDQGIGIAPEDQSRIFERYERIVSDHHQQSLGLGLYIVREIVAAHGGRVRVQSVLGDGSTFIVELPMQLQEGNE